VARRVAQDFSDFLCATRRAYGATVGAKTEIFEMSKIMKQLKNSFNKRFT